MEVKTKKKVGGGGDVMFNFYRENISRLHFLSLKENTY